MVSGMLIGTSVSRLALLRALSASKVKAGHLGPAGLQVRHYYGRERIGSREVVGFGINGEYYYCDRMDYPCPAIRYKEIDKDPKLTALREKEKGDWKKLTIDEKKTLYRANFMRTYAELQAPTGEWKSILAWILGLLSFSLWVSLLTRRFIMPPLPESCSEEAKEKQLQLMIKWRANPIEGISSKWDYDKNDWKVNTGAK